MENDERKTEANDPIADAETIVPPVATGDSITPQAAEQIAAAPVSATAEAPLGSRIGAFLIDVAIVIAASYAIGVVSNTLASAITIAYMLTRDALPFLGGQSIGKKALKIRAVTEDGKSLSGNWSPGLIRNVVLFIPFFALVELVVLITSQGKPGGLRRLGDQWAKTKVITAP